MMHVPYLIRGTKEWDNREYMRFLMGCKVMSFGEITPDMQADPWKYIYVKKRIRKHLALRGVSPEKIEKFVKRPKQ